MILFSDLHLKPDTEEVCFKVLDGIKEAALNKLGDTKIGFLGDFWHIRYNVPVSLLNKVRHTLLDWGNAGLEVIFLPGNHDQVDVAGSHALEVFADLSHVRVYTEPQWDEHGLWVPYRKKTEDTQEALKLRKPKGAPSVLFIHAGVAGAAMNNGHTASEWDGIPLKWVSKFDQVFAGHWHRHQTIKNWTYCGSPWQTRADEYEQLKGFIHTLGGSWNFHPQLWGPQYIKVETLADLEKVLPGDKVRGKIPQHLLMEMQEALRDKGVEDVVLTPVEDTTIKDRLEVSLGGSTTEFAEAYAKEFCGDLPIRDLMAVFAEFAV